MKTIKIILVSLFILIACTSNVQATGFLPKLKNSAVAGCGWELGKQTAKEVVKVVKDSATKAKAKAMIVKKVKKVKPINQSKPLNK